MRQQPSAKSRYALKIKLLLSIVAVAAVVSCGKPADPGANQQQRTVSGCRIPLSKAVIQGDLTEITGLLDSGADINARDALGRTPLHMAAFYGRVKTSRVLIDHGAEINAKDRVGMTPLHVAVISGGRQQVEALLNKKADISVKSESGQTVLHLSAATGQPKLTRFLIERGAGPECATMMTNLPIDYAIQNKRIRKPRPSSSNSRRSPPRPKQEN